VLRSEVANEILIEGLFISLSDGITGDAIGHDFNDSTNVQVLSCAIGDSFVGK
jgi:hypothetical protein